MKENIHQTIQIIAELVRTGNVSRAQELARSLSQQDNALLQALEQIKWVEEKIGTPERLLGSEKTKHGEIAEIVEVGIRKARDLLNRQLPTARWLGGSERFSSADYQISGIDVQAKFIKGTGRNLDHVLKHMQKYNYFGRDNSYYHVPKDQYEIMQRIARGQSVEGLLQDGSPLSQKSINGIQAKIREIEQLSGKPFEQVVKPSISTYAEVQQGEVHKTLDRHEADLKSENDKLKSDIQVEHQPSFGEMARVSAIGAGVGAGFKVTFKLYEKWKEGKNPFKGDFTQADWQDVGIAGLQGGVTGGISGAAIYALTNFADLSAPFAGAVVSANFAIANLGKQYVKGEITADEFLELGQIVCAESALVAISTAVGQTLIPIPVVGAVVGSIAGRMVIDFGKKYLGEESEKLKQRLTEYYNRCLDRIDQTYRDVVASIMIAYERLGNLTDAAFDVTRNTALRLQASVDLAIEYRVPTSKIIHTVDELDAFMMS